MIHSARLESVLEERDISAVEFGFVPAASLCGKSLFAGAKICLSINHNKSCREVCWFVISVVLVTQKCNLVLITKYEVLSKVLLRVQAHSAETYCN